MANRVCVCGHAHDAHEHYRRGTDCATCGPEVCPRFRRALLRRSQPPTQPPSKPSATADAERSSPANLVVTGPLAIVSDLRAHAAKRLAAI